VRERERERERERGTVTTKGAFQIAELDLYASNVTDKSYHDYQKKVLLMSFHLLLVWLLHCSSGEYNTLYYIYQSQSY
jgi:hypothetical protein